MRFDRQTQPKSADRTSAANRSALNRILGFANYDFCPSMNWLVQSYRTPIGWVIAAIVFSLLVGLMVGPQGYILAAAFVTLLVLGLAWPWLSMRGIRCSLVLPERRVSENQELFVTFRVTNYWPLPIFGLIVNGDFLQESGDGDESIAFSLKRIGAWSESEFQVPITPCRRGRLPLGEVIVTNGFPFGLIHVSKAISKSESVLVWPSCEPLQGLPVSASTQHRLQGVLKDKSGEDGDSIGVRCHRNGDRLRNIHWAQSVRSQRLMVRERQSICSTGATVVMDLSPSSHSGCGTKSSYEWTIRIAASICSHLHEAHSPVRVVCIGQPKLAKQSIGNRKGLRPVMDFLADLPTLTAALAMGRSKEFDFDSKIGTASGEPTFLVGTHLSRRLRFGGSSAVIPVVISAAGFNRFGSNVGCLHAESSEVLTRSAESDAACDSTVPSGNGIFITSPETAATQLVSDWNRSFHAGN